MNKKKVAFRVDSSFEIGSGHVMRCLALAEALREQGAELFFLCKEHEGNFNSQIEKKGFKLHILNYPGDFNTIEDAEKTVSVLRAEGGVEWLVADSYEIDHQWEKLVGNDTRSIMVIDDLANRSHDCDILLDQNYHHDMNKRYKGLLPNRCITLLGPRYALLRREFVEARKETREKNAQSHRILITLGGSDPANATLIALEAVLSLNRQDMETDVIAGSSNREKEKIKKLCDEHSNVNFHLHVDNMAQLMAKADLAIGAGGISNWERCCVGLPTIALSIDLIQEKILKAMADDGILLYAGKLGEASPEKIGFTITAVLDNPHFKSYLSKRSMKLVDGNGVKRVVEIMLPRIIKLRPAESADCDNVYNWRNAEENRMQSFDKLPIEYASHKMWYEQTVKSGDKLLLIGEEEDKPVGVIRYDFNDNQAKISVYLVPGMHGKGYGSYLIKAGSSWLRKNCPDIKKINAEIVPENSASEKVFISAGYKPRHKLLIKDLTDE